MIFLTPSGRSDLRRPWLSILGCLVCLPPKTFKLFCFPIFWLWASDENYSRSAIRYMRLVYIYIAIGDPVIKKGKPWIQLTSTMDFPTSFVVVWPFCVFHELIWDVIVRFLGSVIPWFWRHRSVNHVISVTKHIYHGSYEWTYLNQLILRIRWFK